MCLYRVTGGEEKKKKKKQKHIIRNDDRVQTRRATIIAACGFRTVSTVIINMTKKNTYVVEYDINNIVYIYFCNYFFFFFNTCDLRARLVE